jgi:NHL repeat
MIIANVKSRFALATLPILAGLLIQAAGVQAAGTAPIKEIVSAHFGWEVDKKTNARICTVASEDECQPGRESGQPGGFHYPKGVAGASALGGTDGNVYVADRGNHRVQELTATGQFVLMFGKKVNKKGGNVCVQAEESECQAGESSSEPGVFGNDEAVAVDPTSGDLYVADTVFGESGGKPTVGERVQKFTAGGAFVLEIGKEVNETKVLAVKAKGGTPTQKELEEENLCTQKEVETKGVKCTGPAQYGFSATLKAEPGAFGRIGAIAVGGPENRLYVGEQNRLQEFNAEGEPVSEPAEAISARLLEISALPGSHVSELAVDKTGDAYLVYTDPNVILRFDPSGKETALPVNPGARVGQIAVDPSGRLGVIENEGLKRRGMLYEVGATSLHSITEFKVPDYTAEYPYEPSGMGFNSDDDLYVTSGQPGFELTTYEPVPVGELLAKPATCVEGAAHESDATFECILNAEVDPWGVSKTEVWFEWGKTESLGQKTEPPQAITNEKAEGEEEAMVKVSAPITGVLPNEAANYYRLAGHDRWVKGSEELTSPSPLASFKTRPVPPRIVGEPVASYQSSSSVVLFGELNPENANTRYEFQYVPYAACESLEESCPGMAETSAQESAAYGKLATTLEATALQPATTYRYRLFAVNAVNGAHQTAVNETGGLPLPEGTFKTAPAPVPQAVTGAYSALSATSASISGTVNPDGQPATYAFEMGIYNGGATQYGVVFSGPAGASAVPLEESLALTGLQPGTTYAYRIVVKSGYGTAFGATVTFTTAGLPEVLVVHAVLAQLPVPNIAFPKEAAKATPKKLTRAQQLTRALKACAKKAKSKRAACRRSAHKKYAASKTKAKKK